MNAPVLVLTAAELIAEEQADVGAARDAGYFNAEQIAAENRAANVGRWATWTEREQGLAR